MNPVQFEHANNALLFEPSDVPLASDVCQERPTQVLGMEEGGRAHPFSTKRPSDVLPRRFVLLTGAQMKQRPQPRWLVDGLVVEDTLAAIVGAPASYKSFLALDLALSVATGQPWAGRVVHQAPVVYVTAEGGTGMAKRLQAWETFHEVSAPACHFLPEAVAFLEDPQVAALIDAIRTLSETPKLIIVDTVARCLVGGEENSAKDMGRFVANADKVRQATGALVLLVHHVGKTGKGMRGSSALPAALDTIIAVHRTGEAISVRAEKQKDAEEFATITLAATAVEIESGRSSVVLTPTVGRAAACGFDKKAETALRVLADLGPDEVRATEWWKACELAGLSKSSFNRARQALSTGKRVVRLEDGRNVNYVINAISGSTFQHGINEVSNT